MDIYEYIKLDHEKVANLFKQYESTDNKLLKLEIVTMITHELFVHADAEEATFYKALERFEETQDVVQHGEEEHAEIEAMLEDLSNSIDINKISDEKVKALKKLVEHHVKEEEGKIFNKARKVLTKEAAYILKEQMHYLKSQLKVELSAE